MRVLHLYAGNLYGGIERLLVTLARERGHCAAMEPHFGLCFDGLVARELRAAGVPVHLLGEVRFSRPWTVWRARRALRDLLRRERFDVAVCHACWPHAVFAPAVRAAGVPLVFWAHDVPNGTHWLDRRAARTPPDLVIANSRYTRAGLPTLFPGVRSEVLYYPVSVPEFPDRDAVRRAARAELGTGPADVVIVTACRLEPWKGHRLLLAGLGRLRDLSGWRCWVAGGAQRPHEATYLDELKACAAREGIAGRVQFLGQRSDVSRLLAAADIHCQPNTGGEGFGLPVIEALACGAAVVASDIPVLREVGGPAAVYQPEGDVGAWAAAVESLLDNPAAVPPRDARLAWASRYSWAQHARIVLNSYLALLGEGPVPEPSGR